MKLVPKERTTMETVGNSSACPAGRCFAGLLLPFRPKYEMAGSNFMVSEE